MNKKSISKMRVIHGLSFECLQCGESIRTMQYGYYHCASSDYCPMCNACYSVDWRTPLEHSHVEMEVGEDDANTEAGL